MKLSDKEFNAMQMGWRKWWIRKIELPEFKKFGLRIEGKSHFYQHYFPEVVDCESLKHTGLNRKSQLLKLCVIFPAASLALTGICTEAR